MAPSRIMIIRHAEKPDGSDQGVAKDGTADGESLIVKGWQRAGALARFFAPIGGGPLTPQTIYASGVGHHSHSLRPQETVEPLVALLGDAATFVTSFLKDDGTPMMTDAMTRTGIVLVAWEHQLIPALVAALPTPPSVPQTWPDDRFDVVWVLDAQPNGWAFSQLPQMLLHGDLPTVIA